MCLDEWTWLPEQTIPDGLTMPLEPKPEPGSLNGSTWMPEQTSLDGFTRPPEPRARAE